MELIVQYALPMVFAKVENSVYVVIIPWPLPMGQAHKSNADVFLATTQWIHQVRA